MRDTLSISLPPHLKSEIIKRAKKKGKTVSKYILDIIDDQATQITEDEVLEATRVALEEHRAGKTKILKSLDDLM